MSSPLSSSSTDLAKEKNMKNGSRLFAPAADAPTNPIDDERKIVCLFFQTLENFARRKRVIFFMGLIFGALLMVWEDPVAYCAVKRMVWTRDRLLRVDPRCATEEGSILPRRLSSGIASLSRTIATTMPEGLKFNLSEVQRRVADMEQLVDFMPGIAFSDKPKASDHAPGEMMAKLGASAKHPVIMIPGVITTGLELWRGEPCASKYFRQRVWGTFSSLEMFLLNPRCWLRHMMLDPKTGLDPESIRIRAALGFEAADYVIGGYWVWAKLIENLAEIGYTPLNMELVGYDWRLSFENMEIRDRTFTRLKKIIEDQVEISGEKAVVVTHSMGGNVFFYFMQWVESSSGGNEQGWLDRYVEAYTAIGVPFVGIPSALTRLFTGVIREFTELGTVISSLMELHMETKDRRQLMRSWGSIYSMLPKGGNKIWNHYDHFRPPKQQNIRHATGQENQEEQEDMKEPGSQEIHEIVDLDSLFANDTAPFNFAHFGDKGGLDTDELMKQFLELAEVDPYIQMYGHRHSYGVGPPEKVNDVHWSNPLEAPLQTSKMKIYCMYGYGIDTERGYYYTRATQKAGGADDNDKYCEFTGTEDANGEEACTLPKSGEQNLRIDLQDGNYVIDKSVHDDQKQYLVRNGIRYVDGDGSVPLISMGLMCAKAWRKGGPLNPKGTPILTKEYMDQSSPVLTDPLARSGPKSGEHVDIMGNHELLIDLLKIVSGNASSVEERIGSNIKEIAAHLPV